MIQLPLKASLQSYGKEQFIMGSNKGGRASNFSWGKFHSMTNADTKNSFSKLKQINKYHVKQSWIKKAVSYATRSHHLVLILLH